MQISHNVLWILALNWGWTSVGVKCSFSVIFQSLAVPLRLLVKNLYAKLMNKSDACMQNAGLSHEVNFKKKKNN